jgi:hypothetical protein
VVLELSVTSENLQIIKTFWPFDIWALFNPAGPHWPGVTDKKSISWQTLFRFQLDDKGLFTRDQAFVGKEPQSSAARESNQPCHATTMTSTSDVCRRVGSQACHHERDSDVKP